MSERPFRPVPKRAPDFPLEVRMGAPYFIAATDLHAALLGPAPPLVIDVARAELIAERNAIVPTARLRQPADAPEDVLALAGRHVVVLCAHGGERSQGVVAALRASGLDASVLAGGFSAWTEAGLPVVRQRVLAVTLGLAPTTWVTRRRPKIDRVACPWLIHRFLDAEARILFTEPDQVLAVAEALGGIAFDLPAAPFEHDGPRCTFDTILAAFGLDADPALSALAVIVRGADTDQLDLAPQCAGLLAVALGLSARHGDDDHAVLRDGFIVYDGLLGWLRQARHETHHWPRAAPAVRP